MKKKKVDTIRFMHLKIQLDEIVVTDKGLKPVGVGFVQNVNPVPNVVVS